MPPDLQAIAQEMKAAQDEVRQIEPFTSRLPGFDNAAAYEVSRLIHKARIMDGATAIGRKIGFTNPDMWALYGVKEPVWAYVYNKTVTRVSGAQCRCCIGAYKDPKMDPEIIVHFRSDPPLSRDPQEILACVDWLAHGIEIVQSHFPGWRFRAPDTIVDCALHATLLVGQPQPVEKLGATLVADQANFQIRLSCDGHIHEQGKGANVLGGPLTALAHLIDVLATQPWAEAVRGGELVTTRTLPAALPVPAGETWATPLDGIALPGMSVAFEG